MAIYSFIPMKKSFYFQQSPLKSLLLRSASLDKLPNSFGHPTESKAKAEGPLVYVHEQMPIIKVVTNGLAFDSLKSVSVIPALPDCIAVRQCLIKTTEATSPWLQSAQCIVLGSTAQ